MATVATVRRLHNPARRVRRRATTRKNPRRLTLAQRLAGFGGKRSQAAARAARRRKNASTRKRSAPRRASRRNVEQGYYDRRGMFHPIRASSDYNRRRAGEGTRKRTTRRKATRKKATRKRASTRGRTTRRKTARRTRRRNPSEIISLGLVNPAPKRRRRKNAVAKTRRRSTRRRNSRRPNTARRSRRRTVARARRANPYRRTRRRTYRRRARRSNPALGGVGAMLTNGLWLVGGMVGARAVTQMFLQARNFGFLGYGANLLAAVILGGVVGKFARNKRAGQLITLGGVGATVLRLIQDFTPLGGYVQQQLAMSGIQGDVGVGFLEPTTFFVPLAAADGRGATNAQMALPSAVQALAMPAGNNANGMQGLGYGGGSGSRFDTRSRF